MSPDEFDAVATLIRGTLAERGAGKTVCPSEIARRLAGEGEDWRNRMREVHRAVDGLRATGAITLSWQGKPLPTRQGPYRIARG